MSAVAGRALVSTPAAPASMRGADGGRAGRHRVEGDLVDAVRVEQPLDAADAVVGATERVVEDDVDGPVDGVADGDGVDHRRRGREGTQQRRPDRRR